MPNRGKRGNGRGHRGGRGGGGRGRGRGSIGGGGRGRNRDLIASAIGYVYRPRSNVDEFEEDFRIYGQFSSDETDSDTVPSATKKQTKGKKKKTNMGFVRETRPSFGSNYDDHYDDAMDRAGLGLSSSSSRSAAANTSDDQQFAKGKSKYFKKVLFTKSSSSIDLSKANEKVIIQSRETSAEQVVPVTDALSRMTLESNDEATKELAKQELWSMLKVNRKVDVATAETIHYAELESTVQTKEQFEDSISIKQDAIPKSITPESVQKEAPVVLSKDETETIGENEPTSNDEEDDEQDTDASDEEDIEELDFSDDYGDTEDDELLEEDMRTMEDYLEHIELDEGEDLNDLLAWSAMQDDTLEIDDDLYDYDDLDRPSFQADSHLNDFQQERAMVIKKEGKSKYNAAVDESTRKKVGHRTRDDDTVVDPEIFGQSLKVALADVPLGLRPGMRRWYEKQQRKEDRKKKKEEAKAHRKEKKKNGKGKEKLEDDQDFKDQMNKMDERIRDFILDDSISSFQFAPMSTNLRRQLHVLAAAYNLKSKSSGAGGSRCTVVTKTPTTYIAQDRRYISRFLSDIQTNINEQNKIIGKNRSKGVAAQKGKKKFINSSKKSSGTSTPKERRGDAQFPAGPSHGTIVAHDAAPINETNVGHRMLAAMGWKQGEALGSKSEGIIAPIEAIIRKKGRGLGS